MTEVEKNKAKLQELAVQYKAVITKKAAELKAAPTATAAPVTLTDAEKNVVKNVNAYSKYIAAASTKYGIAAAQIKAIIATESQGDVNANAKRTKDNPNPADGASGLMQITSGTWSDTCGKFDELKSYTFAKHRYNAEANIMVGTATLVLKSKAMGVETTDANFGALAVTAYNAGEGTVKYAIAHAKASGSKQPTIDFLKPEHLKPAIEKTKIYQYYVDRQGLSVKDAIDKKFTEITKYAPKVARYLAGQDAETAAPTTTQPATTLKGTVGEKGANAPEDVLLVKSYLIKAGYQLTADNSNCGEKTIEAIKAFQTKTVKMPAPDGLVTPTSDTWKLLKGEKIEDTSAPKPTTPATPTLKGSVGVGGDNNADDVKLVKTQLNKYGYDLTPDNPGVADKTIAAIKDFETKYLGVAAPKGLITPTGDFWKTLGSSTLAKPKVQTPPANQPITSTPTKDKDGKEQTLGGAETDTEKKLQTFMQALSDIQIQINPGKKPEQFIGIRPPYFILDGDSKTAAMAARKANPKVAQVIATIGEGGSGGDGKATPEQIKKFLETCISKGLVPSNQLSAKGLRDFLDKYGVSTDCSGLAVQAINFLNDGDLERDDTDVQGIMNTSMMKDEANDTAKGKKGKFKDIYEPKLFKAGDLMLNYKEQGTKTYHVRVLTDVDVNADGSVEFTTVESTGADDVSAQGDGVGQRRWKFPNGSKIEKLQLLKGSKFELAGTSDQAYRYVRHKTLQ